MNEPNHLDAAALERLRRLGGNAFARRMIELFLDYAAKKIDLARQAQAAGNLAGLASEVHPVKSSAGNVGAVRVQALATRIEELARQHQGESAAPLVAELEQAFAVVKTELEAWTQALPPAD